MERRQSLHALRRFGFVGIGEKVVCHAMTPDLAGQARDLVI